MSTQPTFDPRPPLRLVTGAASEARRCAVTAVATGTLNVGGSLRSRGAKVDDRYRPIEQLGSGAVGAVWKAYDDRLRRLVALKVAFLPDELQRRRFMREARLCSRIHHRNVVQIYDVGIESKTVYYTMELVEGRDLSTVLGEGPLGIPGLMIVLRQIAGALGRVHHEGILHRDIKPSNVVLNESPSRSTNGAVCKLVDFGLATDVQAQSATWSGVAPRPGRVKGTPAYMSPEQIRGEALGPRSDIYGFGCLAYEAFTGAPPFPSEDIDQVLALHLCKRPAPMHAAAFDRIPAASSRALQDLVQRCLAKRPEDRPESMDEVRRMLRSVSVR
jgi:serine/threonine protein kinase